MPAFKYALPVLAAAGYAYADCSTTATATIENSGDASAIATCTTFSGKIAVATGMADDISFGSTLKEIDGDLIIEENTKVKRIDGAALEKISGTLSIKKDPELAGLSFPKLDEVKKLIMEGLPNLRSLNFDSEVSKVDELSIENTKLQSLSGINLNKTNSIRIIANDAISNISMGITNMTGAIEIKDNNADVVVSFPNLQHAGNMTYRTIGNLSLPALKDISPGSFGIQNSKMGSFYANNLTEVKDALTIANNTEMADLSLPLLAKVGSSFRIESNSKLGELTKLNELKEVGAALDISGKNLTKVETPKLDFVKGVFNLQSEGDLHGSCSAYDSLNDKNKLGPKKQYTCKDGLKQAGNKDSGTASGSNNGGKPSDSAASPVEIQTYLGLAGLLTVFFL